MLPGPFADWMAFRVTRFCADRGFPYRSFGGNMINIFARRSKDARLNMAASSSQGAKGTHIGTPLSDNGSRHLSEGQSSSAWTI